eukprot:EG_transcript_544
MLLWRPACRPLPLRPPGVLPGNRWVAHPFQEAATDSPGPGTPTRAPLLPADPPPRRGRPPQAHPLEPAPKRPTTASWVPADSDDQGRQAAEVAVEVTDLDQPSPSAIHERETTTQTVDEARQMAQAMGAERLYDAHRQLFPSSDAPAARLPELLEAAGLPASPRLVAATFAELFPDLSPEGSVPYHHCQALFLHLQHERHRTGSDASELGKAGRCSRWLAGLSDSDSTNLLLIVVVTLCCLSAFLAGGLAILLMVLDDIDTVNTNLQENLGVVQDSLEVYASQIAVQERNTRATLFVATMASVLQSVGFAATVKANTAQLSRVLISVANTYGAWLTAEPRLAFTSVSSMAAKLSNISVATYGRSTTATLFDEVNGLLPDGYEFQLGQWRAGSNQSAVEYLTQFRAGCASNPCTPGDAATAPMKTALAGNTAASWGTDYRGATVYTGASGAGPTGLGVQLNLRNTTLLLGRLLKEQALLDRWTADMSNSWEYMLAYVPSPGVRLLASNLSDCDAACGQRQLAKGMPLARALAGETGTATYANWRGVTSVVAFAPIPKAPVPMGLAIQMAYSDITRITLQAATDVIDNLNINFPSESEEFELATYVTRGNTTNFTHLSAYKFGAECPDGQCVLPTEYLRQAANNCSLQVITATDYRGTPVLASTVCIPTLNAILSFKLDLDDVDSDTLVGIVEAVNSRNAQDGDNSAEFLVARPKPGLTADQVRGYGDFTVVSQLKYPDACARPNCSWDREDALRALQGLEEVFRTKDYRNVDVVVAPVRSNAVSYGIGLAAEQDTSEAFKSTMDVIVQVAAFTAAMAVGCTVALIAIMKLFLRAMLKAREDGNRVVVAEKERFSNLVASMYPRFVVPQLLEGDKQLVWEVPGAAVFFSDICEFTNVSNTLGSAELLQLMGYVYGVMDHISDRFGVNKVKTIGDAYLAVQGLPGSDSQNPSLELLRYAAFVCQVFGDRFTHPTEGRVLAAMNTAMRANVGALRRWGSRLKSRDRGRAESMAPSTDPSLAPSSGPLSRQSTKVTVGHEEEKLYCTMTYGLAVGKIVAGVLGGRCPMFDIWGGTVNLASRMQSTGEPGRIQVSEQLYKKVIAVEGQPFTFDEPRSTYCKGFGNVSAYMVRTTTEGVPRDLQDELRLEPRYGAFAFDNVLTSFSRGGPDAAGPAPAPAPSKSAAAAAPLGRADSEDI